MTAVYRSTSSPDVYKRQVSRDIRELKLTKIPTAGGRQKYAVITDAPENLSKKYERVPVAYTHLGSNRDDTHILAGA